jgi:hypothetical protein
VRRKAFESEGGCAAAKMGLHVGIRLILLALDELEPTLQTTLELCLPLDGGREGEGGILAPSLTHYSNSQKLKSRSLLLAAAGIYF